MPMPSPLLAPGPDAAGSHRGAALRARIRAGDIGGHTSGLAGDLVQANLVVLPQRDAADFLLYCQRNPRPCPLLAVTEAGEPQVPALGHGIDLRTDLPRYRVWRHGELVDSPTDIAALWREDLVSFLIGCSFSFESALVAAGVRLRHQELGTNVPMYRTNIATQAAGRFAGPLVVSMRPMQAADAIRAVQVTSRFPSVHGAPVHLGDPALIGIASLAEPEYGDAIVLEPGELPVFWACGVTPQAAVAEARLEFCITHAPGSMLVTDLLNPQLAAF